MDQVSQDRLEAQNQAVAFARFAASEGWTNSTLYAFCTKTGIAPDQRDLWWPNGSRQVALDLNTFADLQTQRMFEGHSASMSDLLKSRFVQNAEFKSSVARLAASDLIHPIGTLRRTAQTARLLWRLNGQSSPSAGAVWMLVLVYSACVIFWLADRSDRSERTYGAIRRITRLAGWT